MDCWVIEPTLFVISSGIATSMELIFKCMIHFSFHSSNLTGTQFTLDLRNIS